MFTSPMLRALLRVSVVVSVLSSSAALLATTLQLSSVSARSTAQFMIDGQRREARLGVFTDEGLLLEKINDDTAIFRYNGLPSLVRPAARSWVTGRRVNFRSPVRSLVLIMNACRDWA